MAARNFLVDAFTVSVSASSRASDLTHVWATDAPKLNSRWRLRKVRHALALESFGKVLCLAFGYFQNLDSTKSTGKPDGPLFVGSRFQVLAIWFAKLFDRNVDDRTVFFLKSYLAIFDTHNFCSNVKFASRVLPLSWLHR